MRARLGLGFILGLGLGLYVTEFSLASVLDGPIINPENGDSYYLLSEDTWTNCEAEAESLGGFLATVTNQSENDWIFSTMIPLQPQRGDLWIGFYDPDTGDGTGAQHAADFEWISGAPVTYTDWSSGQPNNGPAYHGEYYGAIVGYSHDNLTPEQWNDKTVNGSAVSCYGVAEVVPEPASLALLASAALAALAARRRTFGAE